MHSASNHAASMSGLRTVIVDDSALARLMLRDALNGIGGVQVVGNAAEGAAALDLIDAVEPDLIILDVEMPGMNGLEMLKAMNARGLSTPVLMCSRLTSAGAEVTTEALLQGAYDFVCKPSGGSRKENISSLRDEIAGRIGPLIPASEGEFDSGVVGTSPVTNPPHCLAGITIDAVLIGASTGGPAALRTLLARLDPRIKIPILVVQHIPVGFSEPLARRLRSASRLEVHEASDDAEIVGGTVYIARAGRHLTIQPSSSGPRLKLVDSPAVNGCRPSVDVMLKSALGHFGNRCLGVVLTGMGRDGAAGAKEIREAGGIVFAQNPESCTVSSMPRQTIRKAGADRVGDVCQLGELINRLIVPD